MLDSVQPTKEGYRGFIDAEQLDWLAQDLERIPSTQPVIVVTHMPLRTAAGDNQVVANARAVLDVLMRRRLVLVLQGHVQKAEAFQEGGVTFLTGGAVCGTADCRGTEPGFVVAKVRPDRVEWRYVKSGA